MTKRRTCAGMALLVLLGGCAIADGGEGRFGAGAVGSVMSGDRVESAAASPGAGLSPSAVDPANPAPVAAAAPTAGGAIAARPRGTPAAPKEAPAGGGRTAAPGANAVAAAATGGPGGPMTVVAPSAPAAQTQAAPDVSDVGVDAHTIKLGAILPLSGPIGPYGKPWLEALQTPFRVANDAGGVNGRKFVFVFCDDAFQGDQGLACAKKLVDQDRVFMLLSDGSAAGSTGAVPYLVEKGVPVGNAIGLNPAEFQNPLIFPMTASAPTQGHIMARYTARELGAKKVGLITLGNVASAADLATGFREGAAAYGLDIVSDARINFQDADCSSQIVQTQSRQPDSVFLASDASTAIKCFAAANSLGYKPPKQFTSGSYTYIDLIPKYGGAAADGHVTMALNNTPDTTANAFMTEYLQRTTGYYPNHGWWAQTPSFYAAAALNVETLRTLGRDVTRARFVAALNTATNAAPGLGIDVTYRPGTHDPSHQALILQLQGGRFVPRTGFLSDEVHQ